MALTDKLTDIADAIREKGGTLAKLTPAGMPDAIREIGEEPVRLVPGKTLRMQAVLATKDGTEYTIQDGDALNLHLWHGASTLDATSTTTELSVDVPGDATVGRWHWTLTLTSGGAEYLVALGDCDCVQVYNLSGISSGTNETSLSPSAKLAVVHGVVDESREWGGTSENDSTCYACKNETVTSIGSYSHSNSLVCCARFPKVTSLGVQNFYACHSLESVELSSCKSIGSNAFNQCYSIKALELPSCTTVGPYSLQGLSALTSVELPAAASIGTSALYGAWRLTSLSLPVCQTLGVSALRQCHSLPKLELPTVTSIGNGAFAYSLSLRVLSLPGETVPTCGTTVLVGCPCFNEGGIGRIYVNDDLVDDYKSADGWSTYAEFIKPISEWDGTVPELPVNATASAATVDIDDINTGDDA
jgi:hypothetical protein